MDVIEEKELYCYSAECGLTPGLREVQSPHSIQASLYLGITQVALFSALNRGERERERVRERERERESGREGERERERGREKSPGFTLSSVPGRCVSVCVCVCVCVCVSTTRGSLTYIGSYISGLNTRHHTGLLAGWRRASQAVYVCVCVRGLAECLGLREKRH